MSRQLPQVLIRNSFNILGLSSSTALKEIRKRSQQLLQLAKIEEIQEFDTDIGHIREFRTESEVRLALERISGIKERLREIFFWFDDHNIVNQKAITLISQENYSEAIDILKQSNKISMNWLTCKNLALTLMFQAFAISDLNSFCRSLELWKRITESDDFWKFYEKHYLLHDEFGTSSSLFQEFRGSIYEALSAKVVSFYHQTRDSEVIGFYYFTFGKIGTSIDIQVLQPIVHKIKKEIEDLEKIATDSNNEKISENDESLIKLALEKIDKYFVELDKFNLSDYSSLTVLKNDSAEQLRSICTDMYNQDSLSTKIALLILDQSARLVISEAISSKIESDQNRIKENDFLLVKNCELLVQHEDIKELIYKQKFREAQSGYLSLDNSLAKQGDEFSNSSRIFFLLEYCSQLMEKGHALFEMKKFGIRTLALAGLLNWRNHKDAIHCFEQALEILTERVYLLSFVCPSSDRSVLLQTLENISSSLKDCDITSLVDYHLAHLDTIEELANRQENEKTQATIKLLGVAICFSIFYRRYRATLIKKMWKWIGWGAVIAFYFLMMMNSNKIESKTSKQSNYQSKTSHQSLTDAEKKIIEVLQKNEPEALRKIREDGYSDKQIARYLIEHAEDKEE